MQYQRRRIIKRIEEISIRLLSLTATFINIIRLFLGDIILEILFDIISLSVENISLWLYIGLYLY